MKEPIKGLVEYDYMDEAQEALGYPGAMLSGSKTEPKGETVYWNACVFNENGAQIWHGDLNLTKRSADLQALADRVGKIYVTPEQPFRFDGLDSGYPEQRERIVTFEPEASP